MTTSRAFVRVTGRVQGVGFRYATVDQASRHGLAGWVRNTPDGAVEVAAEGPRTAVERLVAWCRHGPPAARVDAVEVTWEEPGGRSDGFHIR